MSNTYDGRVSDACKERCSAGDAFACRKTMGDPYGCGTCCSCMGGCYEGAMEQMEEERQAAADKGSKWVGGCTCNAVFMGPGSGHESYCGWENP